MNYVHLFICNVVLEFSLKMKHPLKLCSFGNLSRSQTVKTLFWQMMNCFGLNITLFKINSGWKVILSLVMVAMLVELFGIQFSEFRRCYKKMMLYFLTSLLPVVFKLLNWKLSKIGHTSFKLEVCVYTLLDIDCKRYFILIASLCCFLILKLGAGV